MILEKGKNLSLSQNYRPISLLPTMDEAVERIIKNKLENYAEKRWILLEQQFAFWKWFGAEQKIMRVIEKIKERFQRKDLIGVALLYVDRPLDRVSRDDLMHKTNQMNVPRRLIRLLDSHLGDRTLWVRTEKCKSSTRTTEAGVPQGAIECLILFSIYVADLPTQPAVEKV